MSPILPHQPDELVLTESRTMRDRTIARTDVLDKVKALSLLPDGVHADIPTVARYFEVAEDAIESVVRRNREELSENGLRVLRGAEYREFATVNLTGANPKARHVALFTRRAILNVGQLLTESEISRRVRSYLLEVEAVATPEQRDDAIVRAELARVRLDAMGIARQSGLVNPSYMESMARHELARMLGEEPELDPLDVTITADEFLTEQGVAAKDLPSARTRMGRAVAALYRARYQRDPQKIKRPVNGAHRDVAVYTRRDLDLFENAWSAMAANYDVQTRLT